MRDSPHATRIDMYIHTHALFLYFFHTLTPTSVQMVIEYREDIAPSLDYAFDVSAIGVATVSAFQTIRVLENETLGTCVCVFVCVCVHVRVHVCVNVCHCVHVKRYWHRHVTN